MEKVFFFGKCFIFHETNKTKRFLRSHRPTQSSFFLHLHGYSASRTDRRRRLLHPSIHQHCNSPIHPYTQIANPPLPRVSSHSHFQSPLPTSPKLRPFPLFLSPPHALLVFLLLLPLPRCQTRHLLPPELHP